MGHHNFDPTHQLDQERAIRSVQEHLESDAKLDEMKALRKSMEAAESRLATRDDLVKGLRELSGREISEEIRERMRLDRAKAEAEQG